jgi:hypothetical protein
LLNRLGYAVAWDGSASALEAAAALIGLARHHAARAWGGEAVEMAEPKCPSVVNMTAVAGVARCGQRAEASARAEVPPPTQPRTWMATVPRRSTSLLARLLPERPPGPVSAASASSARGGALDRSRGGTSPKPPKSLGL